MKKAVFNSQISDYEIKELSPEELEVFPEEHQIPYEQRVASLIRHKYSIDDEIAINRQRETKPEEWQEYFDYCEWCKVEANRK